MRTRFRNLLGMTVALALGSGCTVETAKDFRGPPEDQRADWSAGRTLRVQGLNGEIRLESGSPAEVKVTFKPFAIDGYTKEDEARDAMAKHLKKSLSADANGNIVVVTDKDGGGTGLGAHMVVYLPPEFDSSIVVENGNGEVEIDFVGNASVLNVKNNGAGDCLIEGAPSIKASVVSCSFDTRLTNVADSVDIRTGLGDITASLASVSAGTTASYIAATDGNVNLTMPASGGYSVQAKAFGGGKVNEGSLPAGCTVNAAADNSKTVSCATGPNYVVNAGDDSSFACDVNLAYQ